jgi:uncharacterized membrane protein
MADLIAIGYPDPTTAMAAAVEAMSKYGGTVLKTSLSEEGEEDLQEALHGESAA